MAAFLVGLLLAAELDVSVRSAGDCPTAAAVSERLAALGPREVARDRESLVADLRPLPGAAPALELRLARQDGTALGQRRLDGQRSCAELAELAAVLIASWQLHPRSGVQLELDRPPVADDARGLSLDFGLGAGAALVGGVAPAAHLEFLAGPARARWQARIAVWGQGSRRRVLYPGSVDWQRVGIAAGPAVRLARDPWVLAVDAGATFGGALLAGHGFTRDDSARSFELGAEAGLRLGRRFGRLTLAAEMRAATWFERERVVVRGLDGAPDELPRLDLLAGLAVAVAVFP